jgi:hypothetical protein
MVPYGAATRWVVRVVKEIRVGRGVVRYGEKAPPEAKELSAAAIIADKFDAKIFLRGTGVKGADALIDGVKWELKTLEAATNNAVSNNIKKSMRSQSSRIIIDGRAIGLSEGEAIAGIARAARDGYSPGELIVLLPDKILRF